MSNALLKSEDKKRTKSMYIFVQPIQPLVLAPLLKGLLPPKRKRVVRKRGLNYILTSVKTESFK